jgi:hypothetical protein
MENLCYLLFQLMKHGTNTLHFAFIFLFSVLLIIIIILQYSSKEVCLGS